MLDMGFTPQIEMILKFVPKTHQTLLFSATLPQNILRISERYLNSPERISTGATSIPIAKIKQETLQVFKENKYDELIDQFLARKGSILVFVKTKRGADKMVKKLKEEGHSADAIHGDLRQSKRDRVINSFRKGLKRILIATDVAARGLDIPLIQHVINYDLPQVPEDYIHRIGRTARAGSEGSALTFLTPDDRSMWNSINKLIDPNFKSAPSGSRIDSRKRRGKGPNNKKRKARNEKRSYGKGRQDRSSSFRDKPKSYSKTKSNESSRDRGKKSFGYKGKSSFRDRFSRDGEKKSFGYKGKSSFTKKNDSKPFGFTNNPKYFGKKPSENTSANLEKKSFGFKGKKKFKSRNSRPKNFTFKKHSQKRANS
jgi:superfamily II DNA/RNA helicase